MPLSSEFQRKLQLQSKQFQSKSEPRGPKEHPEDTMIVRNILISDNTEVEEVIPYANARQSIDPQTGQAHFVNQIDNNIYEHSWNTADFFEVRWDGRPHRIRPGETRNMPRYLADHFAKNLIDFMLIKREEKEKVTGLLKNRSERLKLYKQIIVGVASYYNGDTWDYEREGTFVEQQVDSLNQTDGALNLGEVPNLAIGYGLTDSAPEELEPLPPVAPPSAAATAPTSREELVASKSIAQLRSEAKQLGIEVKPTMNKETLVQAILNF